MSAGGASSRQFWKPGTVAPGSTVEREDETEGGEGGGVIVYNPRQNLSLRQQRMQLPIYAARTPCCLLSGWSAHCCGRCRQPNPLCAGKVPDPDHCRANGFRQDHSYVPASLLLCSPCSIAASEIPQYLNEAGWTAGTRVVVRCCCADCLAGRHLAHVDCVRCTGMHSAASSGCHDRR